VLGIAALLTMVALQVSTETNWYLRVLMVGSFGSLLLLLIGGVDEEMRRRARRRAARSGTVASRAGAELSHRWGWKIFYGAVLLYAVIFICTTVVSLYVGLSLGEYWQYLGYFLLVTAALGIALFLVILLARGLSFLVAWLLGFRPRVLSEEANAPRQADEATDSPEARVFPPAYRMQAGDEAVSQPQ
jgi:hypothetical protein